MQYLAAEETDSASGAGGDQKTAELWMDIGIIFIRWKYNDLPCLGNEGNIRVTAAL